LYLLLQDEPAPWSEGSTWQLKSEALRGRIDRALSIALDRLAEVSRISFVVTSVARTPREQAAAMADQARTDGLQALLDLYGDDEQVRTLWPALSAGEVDEAAAMIEDYARAGRPISRHLAIGEGRAVDIRTRDLDRTARARLMMAAKGLGWEAIEEADHIHIERARLA
jgi:hypothetical protein